MSNQTGPHDQTKTRTLEASPNIVQDAVMPTYARLPVAFESGEGCWLTSTNGVRFFDALSGIAVCNLGHAHPDVATAIARQAETLVHTSNLYEIDSQRRLAQRLAALSKTDRIFFCNSGAEANEAAIKLARRFGHNRGIENPVIITALGSFHGRTLATLTATGNPKVQRGFKPLVPGFQHVPYDDAQALETAIRDTPDVVAVLLEPIQGEGGVRIPLPDYLRNVRRLCDDHGVLMMLDEVQTGMCRTGAWFAADHAMLRPDVMTLAKALGNGVPIGACLASGEAAKVLDAGSHGSTFGGNPLACAAALATLEVMEKQDAPRLAQARGAQLLAELRAGLRDLPMVVEVRGQGLMIGIELNQDCSDLVTRALEARLLINVTAGRVVRLLPPLVITEEETTQLARQVIALIRDFAAQLTARPS